MEDILRGKVEQEQSAELDGLDREAALALIYYFQINSRFIRKLFPDDRRMLIDVFDLHGLRQEMETHAANAAKAAITDIERVAVGEDTETATTQVDDQSE